MDIVYHYANTQAFKGVVENAEVWATDFRYLNDPRELAYTWSVFVEKLEQLAEQQSDHIQAYQAQLEALRLLDAKDLMGFDDAMFVACFSELSDAVSQWTRYGGGDGRGFALGFDAERVRALKVPQYYHSPNGKLVPVKATIAGGGPTSGQQTDLTWGAFLQKVQYGDDAVNLVVDQLIDVVQRIGVDSGTYENNVANCISQTHALVHRLPLVKHSQWQDELEHRITITEHLGGRSFNQRSALQSLGEPFSFYAQGALMTVDVQFRPDDSKVFTPYVRLPFDREALVEVVIGPVVKHHLAETTVRRFLNRYGFRDTKIEISQAPLQV